MGRRTANFARASSLAEQKFAGGLKYHDSTSTTDMERLIKRGYGTSCEMVLLRISVMSVAYSRIVQTSSVSTTTCIDHHVFLVSFLIEMNYFATLVCLFFRWKK